MFRIKLSVLSGDDGIEDKVFERRDGEVKLGRASKSGGGEEPSPRNGLFRNALTSRSHCSLVWHTEGIDIKDHSSHGTIIKRDSSSTHIKDGSMRLEDGDIICLGREIQKTQSDGRKIGHEAVRIKVSIESLPESPKHSSPYRLELQEQLASDVEEDELKSDNVVPDNNDPDVSGDIITTEISTAVRVETEVAVNEQEEAAHQEMQRATSDQPPGSPLSAYQSSEVRLRSSSPGAEDAVQPASSKISKLFSYLSRETSPSMPEEAKESVAEIPTEQTAMLQDNKEISPDVTSQTLSAEVSPNKLVQGETATTSALPLFLPSTPDPAGNSSIPQQKMRSGMRGPLPVALERVQIVRQSPSVSSRKNRYLGAIQQLNKGGIDQESAASPIGGSARKSFSKGVTANSSRQASEEPSCTEQKDASSNLLDQQQSTRSTIEIPDSQVETEGAEQLGKHADHAVETTTSKAEAGAVSVKRKADEIEGEGSLTEVNLDERPGTTTRPTKRIRKSGIWKKVAANTGVFALGAVTAVAGLLLWPEED